MNFTVYIQDEMGPRLDIIAKAEKKSRNALVREALELYVNQKSVGGWPQEVLEFKSVETPAFESFRHELHPLPLDRGI